MYRRCPSGSLYWPANGMWELSLGVDLAFHGFRAPTHTSAETLRPGLDDGTLVPVGAAP